MIDSVASHASGKPLSHGMPTPGSNPSRKLAPDPSNPSPPTHTHFSLAREQMEGLQFDNEELRHETEFLRNKVATFYHEASMRADGGHSEGGGVDMRQETPPSQPNSLRCVCTCSHACMGFRICCHRRRFCCCCCCCRDGWVWKEKNANNLYADTALDFGDASSM